MNQCATIDVPMVEIVRAFSIYKEEHGHPPGENTTLTLPVAGGQERANRQDLAGIIREYRFPQYDSPTFNSAFMELVERGMGLNGSFIYDLSIFPRYSGAITRHMKVVPERTLQIGPGGSLGCEVLLTLMGVKEASTLDPFPLLTFDLNNFMGSLSKLWQVVTPLAGVNGFDPSPLPFPAYSALGPGEYRVGDGIIRHFHPRSFEATGFLDGSVDFLYSHATLEHVRDPLQCIREAARILRPGGVTAHCIDLRDHRNFDQPLDFLFESAADWESRMEEYCRFDASGYMNRWRAGEFRAAFEGEGFEILEFNAEVRVADTLLSGTIPKLHRHYRCFSIDDLSITTLSLVARKPGGEVSRSQSCAE
ncbi:MAG: methyltransferase domain-containing protein [Geobacteraceae bacterium]